MPILQRYIAHFDLDSFFVSVEVLNHPGLKGKPVIVGGHSERGVVAACSYEARKFGIHSAMPMKKALQLCPQAIVTNSSRGEYSRYSRMVTDIIAAKAPLFEKASIDEFYIDLTGMDKYFDPYQWAIDLRQEIIDKTGLPISFALASNKMVSKIATNEAKPNGYIKVPPGFEKAYLAPLSANKIPGVGEQTFMTLMSMGIKTIGDITRFDIGEMETHLGKYGIELWNKANGLHESPVTNFHEAKSISTENTFDENKTNISFILSELVRMAEKVGYELRQDKKVTGCVAVKIRYGDFSTFTRQMTIDFTLSDEEIIKTAKALFHKLYKKGTPIRLLGVRLSELTQHVVQPTLFEDVYKRNNLYKAIDAVKNKYGKSALKKATTIRKEG